MHFLSTISALSLIYVSLFDRLPFVSAVNTVLTNDDGWAVANIRAFNTALLASGFNVVLSAPAENESGTGSSDAPATTVGSSGCEFDSCPAGSPPEGNNASDTRLNYVNSFPVTAVRFGIQTLAPQFFGGPPEIVVSGPNVGTNLGTGTTGSGTVGAATEAAKEGIPAIAFSGSTGSQVSFTTLSTSSSSTTAAEVYASLAVSLTSDLLSSGTTPILPANINLNVNFPSISSRCASSSDFSFVFTRINTATSSTPPDVETCGSDRLPTETSVVEGSGCFASVSVMNATTKDDVDASTQAFVLDKLSGFLVCS